MSHNFNDFSVPWSSATSSPATFPFGISPIMSPLESPAMSPSISPHGPSGAQLIPRVIAAVGELNQRYPSHEWSVKPDGGLVIVNKETGIRATTCPHPSCAKGVANKRSNCVSRHFASNHAPNTLPFICGGNCPSRTNRRDHFIAHLKRNSARCAAHLLLNAADPDVIKMMQVCYPPSKEPSWELALARDTNPANVDAQLRKRGTSLDSVIPGASAQFNLQQVDQPAAQPAVAMAALPPMPFSVLSTNPSMPSAQASTQIASPTVLQPVISNTALPTHAASNVAPDAYFSPQLPFVPHWNCQDLVQIQALHPKVPSQPANAGHSSLGLLSQSWVTPQHPGSGATPGASSYGINLTSAQQHLPVMEWNGLLDPSPGSMPPPTAEQLAAQSVMFDWLMQPLGGTPDTVPSGSVPSIALAGVESTDPETATQLVPEQPGPVSSAGQGGQAGAPCPIASLFSDVWPSN